MPGVNTILGVVSTLEEIQRDFNSVYVRKGVESKEKEVIQMNVDQLYDEGVNSLGVSISSYAPYTPYSVFLKKQKGQPFDRVTLRDTGAFHSSFILVLQPDDFYITATDGKTQELVDKYGSTIFGLVPNNVLKLSHDLYPVVLEEINKQIFK